MRKWRKLTAEEVAEEEEEGRTDILYKIYIYIYIIRIYHNLTHIQDAEYGYVYGGWYNFDDKDN